MSQKNILIVGVGPGISTAVARAFGKQGFKVGLISLEMKDAEEAKVALGKADIKAYAFACDAGDSKALTATVAKAQAALGPISVLHYNAASVKSGGNVMEGPVTGVQDACAVATTGVLAAVRALHADLKEAGGCVLVTGSGAGAHSMPAEVEAMLVGLNIAGYVISNAAKFKLVNHLHPKLKADGIFVGQVIVNATVKTTSWDDGTAKIELETVGDAFWKMYKARSDHVVYVDNPSEKKDEDDAKEEKETK